VRDLAAQVDWGIPFNRALGPSPSDKLGLGEEVGGTIIETYKVGEDSGHAGRHKQVLVTIEGIRKERSASVRSEVVTSYMI